MTNEPDIIRSIDNAVRDYQVSRDAMRWTPDPDDTRATLEAAARRFRADPEATQRMADSFGILQSQLRRNWRLLIDTFQPLVAWAESPKGQAALARMAELRESVRGCHCFCGVSHPDQSEVCLGEVLEDDLRYVHYDAPTVGPHDVPMCGPCADAARAGAVTT